MEAEDEVEVKEKEEEEEETNIVTVGGEQRHDSVRRSSGTQSGNQDGRRYRGRTGRPD